MLGSIINCSKGIMTETWVLGPSSVMDYTVRGWVALFIQEAYSFRALLLPKITGLECVSLAWEAEESPVIWLVSCPPSAPASTLPSLVEAISGWCALSF